MQCGGDDLMLINGRKDGDKRRNESNEGNHVALMGGATGSRLNPRALCGPAKIHGHGGAGSHVALGRGDLSGGPPLRSRVLVPAAGSGPVALRAAGHDAAAPSRLALPGPQGALCGAGLRAPLRTPNDHYDQGSTSLGLQCIQGSVALATQLAHAGDGHGARTRRATRPPLPIGSGHRAHDVQ